jgi:cell division septum initiation protein DivIVA
MEITPRELRDVEIAEAFRGYNRDVVNDLLERAAASMEASNERVRELSDRLQAAQFDADRSRETEDILHRTLLLAQRAADEAIAEAQTKSRAMMEEAELESHRLLAEAQSEAQRRGDEERARLEDEVVDLHAKRETLLADVDALTTFEQDYRDRLADALERDLDSLRNRTTVAPGDVPAVEPVELPVHDEGVARPEALADPAPVPVDEFGGPSTRSEPASAFTPAVDSYTGQWGETPADAGNAPDAPSGAPAEFAAPETYAPPSEPAADTPDDAPAALPFETGDSSFAADTSFATGEVESVESYTAAAEAANAFQPTTAASTPWPEKAAPHEPQAADTDEPTRQVDMTALFDAEAEEHGSQSWAPDPTSSYESEVSPAAPAAPAAAPASEPAPARGTSDNTFDMLRPDVLDSEVLDDDAFFATLREAVHDESPLGPRDDTEADADMFGDGGERASFRDVFRRRR